MLYKHTQPGNLIIYTTCFVVILFAIILTKAKFNIGILFLMIFIILLLASFSTLTVLIDGKNLKIKFGYGLFKKTFKLDNIKKAKAVKNRWYYGWGIRVWFWPYMWIYNVSGFDAVEIKMKNNKIYRIGTDEPKKLEKVILKNIK